MFSSWKFWVGIGVVGAFIWATLAWGLFWSLLLFGVGVPILFGFIWKARKASEIVECVNCHNKMTHSRFQENGGCLWCGSDLVYPSGRHTR